MRSIAIIFYHSLIVTTRSRFVFIFQCHKTNQIASNNHIIPIIHISSSDQFNRTFPCRKPSIKFQEKAQTIASFPVTFYNQPCEAMNNWRVAHNKVVISTLVYHRRPDCLSPTRTRMSTDWQPSGVVKGSCDGNSCSPLSHRAPFVKRPHRVNQHKTISRYLFVLNL